VLRMCLGRAQVRPEERLLELVEHHIRSGEP
jgi:hypothetical protein